MRCEVCYNNYNYFIREPYNFTCGHTFCETCCKKCDRICPLCKIHSPSMIKNYGMIQCLEMMEWYYMNLISEKLGCEEDFQLKTICKTRMNECLKKKDRTYSCKLLSCFTINDNDNLLTKILNFDEDVLIVSNWLISLLEQPNKQDIFDLHKQDIPDLYDDQDTFNKQFIVNHMNDDHYRILNILGEERKNNEYDMIIKHEVVNSLSQIQKVSTIDRNHKIFHCSNMVINFMIKMFTPKLKMILWKKENKSRLFFKLPVTLQMIDLQLNHLLSDVFIVQKNTIPRKIHSVYFAKFDFKDAFYTVNRSQLRQVVIHRVNQHKHKEIIMSCFDTIFAEYQIEVQQHDESQIFNICKGLLPGLKSSKLLFGLLMNSIFYEFRKKTCFTQPIYNIVDDTLIQLDQFTFNKESLENLQNEFQSISGKYGLQLNTEKTQFINAQNFKFCNRLYVVQLENCVEMQYDGL